MTLLTVVKDVCAAVGVEQPTTVFAGINANRTMQEMLALANEMAQRIAYDTREWGLLKRVVSYDATMATVGTPAPLQGAQNFLLPADYKRMLLTTNVRRSSMPAYVLRFIPDADEWLQRRVYGYHSPGGEWTSFGNVYISISPPLAVDSSGLPIESLYFVYLSKSSIALASGGAGDVFVNDDDTFRLDERVLKLGMIFQWKALKGSPYAEDMSTYETALAHVAGADKPAPIIIGRLPLSSAVSQPYPFPIDPNMVPL